jgi:FAD/FMN-containing dehydrogenase
MRLEALRRHPAFLQLDAAEQAAVEARLGAFGADADLDARGVAALAGGLEALEADDLRLWLAATARGRWALLAVGASPEADALFSALLAEAPGLIDLPSREAPVARLRDAARAFAAAQAALDEVGFVQDDLLGALALRVEQLAPLAAAWTAARVLAAASSAGLGGAAEALSRHQEEARGLRGLAAALERAVRNTSFDLAHGGAYLFTGAPHHEGRYEAGEWRNWTADYAVRPAAWACPADEAQLAEVVRGARQLRVVGGGHSFNDGPLSPDTMVSLDAMARVLAVEPEARTIRVEAGIRLRDLNKVLAAHGLGLPMLGSTDTQSLGGLVATDLHGTGRDRGFLSEQVRAVRVMDHQGQARTVRPGEPLFHAVFGAIGACGVVFEVELAAEPAFNLEKRTRMVDRATAEADIARLLQENQHVSFYYGGGADAHEAVRLHTWNHTSAPVTEGWAAKKARQELKDFAISAFLPSMAELVVELDEDNPISDALAPDDALILPGQVGFGRKLFYRHDELEYAVPFEAYRACLQDILQLLADEDFFSIVEVRFTPDTGQSLIGPGAGRRSAWIELATPLGQPRDALYARAEELLRRYGGRPHLGKKTSLTAADLAGLHGARFGEFQAVRAAQDPGGKFLNPFTRRLFTGA